MSDKPHTIVLEQALAASAADNAEEAIELFGRACALAPSEPVPYFLLGAEFAEARRYPEAEAAYSAAVALAPGFAIARYELGTLQFVLLRVDAAFVTWRPLLDLAQGDPLKLFVQGYAALTRDLLEEALDFFQQGIAANRANAALNANIRQVIARIELAKSNAAPAGTVDGKIVTSHVLLDGYRRQGSLP
jgi:tetratricopeptide (TPR) repeat protein